MKEEPEASKGSIQGDPDNASNIGVSDRKFRAWLTTDNKQDNKM